MKTRCTKCRKKMDRANGAYCEKCSSVIRKENRTKPTNMKMERAIQNQHWRKIREQIISRDKGCCRLCLVRGYIENRKLEVHHIYKRVDAEELVYSKENLVTVCIPCHNELENLSPVKQFELLKMEKADFDYSLL